MTQYLFIFGRKPLLSLTEIISVFPQIAIKNLEKNHAAHAAHAAHVTHAKYATLEFPETFENPQKTLDHLGGTRLIAEKIENPSPENLIQIIKNHHTKKEKKIIFSMTMEDIAHQDKRSMKNLLKKIKKNLNKEGIKSRYQEKYLGGEGTHFIAYAEEKKLKIGLIKAIQDFKAYSRRDYEKPFRDTKSGMLPPKLAQIMINLGCIKTPSIKTSGQKIPMLYDPFCGSGTVLMEAALMGFNIIGSDIDEKAIEGAKKNITQLATHNFQKTPKLFTKDITKLNPSDLEKKPDIIVTEAYLGPFFEKPPTQEAIEKIQKDLENLYAEALKKLSAFHVPIVIALPAHKISMPGHISKHFPEPEYKFLPNIHKIIEQAGLKIKPVFPENPIKYLKHFSTSLDTKTLMELGYHPNRKTFLYDRPDQKIAREIFVLEPKQAKPVK